MTDIVNRAKVLTNDYANANRQMQIDLADDLDDMVCELVVEIEKLRAALRIALDAIIKMDGLGDDDGTIAENAEKVIREALGDN